MRILRNRRLSPTLQRHAARGFTLIELMIVVAIIAILAAIAYPSYRNSVMKSDRADAKIALTTTAQAMERCYTQYNSYTDINCPISPKAEVDSPQRFYTITAPSLKQGSFELSAVPSADSSQQNDTQCHMFTLDNTGRRTAASQSGADTTSKCW